MSLGIVDDLLPVLDVAGTPTGELVPAERAHADGAWHGAVVVWVVRPGGAVLVRRNARTAPFDASRLGPPVHVHAGLGSPTEAALAAVGAQLGLDARRSDLLPLGSFVLERRGAGLVDRERQEAFALVSDVPLDRLLLDPADVDTVYEVPLERAAALAADGAYVPVPGWDAMQRVSDALLIEEDLPAQGREVLVQQLTAVAAALAGRAPGG